MSSVIVSDKNKYFSDSGASEYSSCEISDLVSKAKLGDLAAFDSLTIFFRQKALFCYIQHDI